MRGKRQNLFIRGVSLTSKWSIRLSAIERSGIAGLEVARGVGSVIDNGRPSNLLGPNGSWVKECRRQ